MNEAQTPEKTIFQLWQKTSNGNGCNIYTERKQSTKWRTEIQADEVTKSWIFNGKRVV